MIVNSDTYETEKNRKRRCYENPILSPTSITQIAIYHIQHTLKI